MYIHEIHTVAYSADEQGRNESVVEVFVDNSSELPARDGLNGMLLSQGSMGYVINTGKVYVMNSDGEWIDTDGNRNSSTMAFRE